MNIFKKVYDVLFSSESTKEEERSKYMPEPEIPVEELFVTNFKKNGGKFIYCENIDEVKENLELILEENDWFEKEAITYEPSLEHFLEQNKLFYKNPTAPSFLLCGCEGLIANEGAILFSSTQLKNYKPSELPRNIVVYAGVSMIMKTKSDGLRNINRKYKNRIPTNITTLDCFDKRDSLDFLQYGKEAKNIYLILLEDC